MPATKPPFDAPLARQPGLTAPSERELRQHNTRHRMIERRRIVQKLRQALAAEELALHFQPIISLENGLARGAEALLRLTHARRGLIPASHFLPLAEQSDIIIDVDGWILRTVCAEIIHMPPHFSISLALSQRYLQSGKLVRHLLEALSGSGVAPERLELLITEAILLDDNEDTIFALKAIQGLGVHLGLSQFGAGYASLAPLKRLLFSTLRLDKTLVQNLCEDSTASAIIHAAAEAGHALGCRVLADGVENAEQYEWLCKAHVDDGQGSFFGAAVPGTELATMFRVA